MDWFFFTQIFLASYFTFVAALYTVRLTVGDSTRNTPKVFPGKKYSSTWWNHMVFRWFRAAIWLICVLRVFLPAVDNALILLPFAQTPWVLVAGMALMSSGFVVALISHRQLGVAWRSGIDPAGPQILHCDGLYKFSRNPMYIGVMMAQIGFFLALPSVFTLCCMLVGIIALIRQTAAEEKHLRQFLPEAYKDYSQHVPRWLFTRPIS